MLLSVLLLAAPAAAQQVNAPPGNSGVDEYLETVPGATGDRPSGSTERSRLPPSARDELAREGADGRAAAELAERGAGTQDDATKATPSEALKRGKADGGGTVGTLGRAVSGSDEGMGVWLPLLLLVSAAGALAAVLFQRRGTQQ